VYHDVELQRGARIAQLVLAEADHESAYAGSYQGENVE
jgi:dUTP pyrophosphatase